jgi:hypothetical protein
MALAKITGPGLSVIAGSVCLLWGLVLGEASLMRRATAERAEVMKSIQLRQRRSHPQNVLSPRFLVRRVSPPAAG